MTRLARGRKTHLDRSEVATTMLAIFDEGEDPSIRLLAKRLSITPSAIYHHFESRAEIVELAADVVWEEIVEEAVEEAGEQLEADPAEFLVAASLCTRRAFVRHYAIAPYAAATPVSDELSSMILANMALLFERLGLHGEEAGRAFHSYSTYTFGGALFAAARQSANLALERNENDAPERFRSQPSEELKEHSSEATRSAIDQMVDVSTVDPEVDERLYEADLRKLIEGLRPTREQ